RDAAQSERGVRTALPSDGSSLWSQRDRLVHSRSAEGEPEDRRVYHRRSAGEVCGRSRSHSARRDQFLRGSESPESRSKGGFCRYRLVPKIVYLGSGFTPWTTFRFAKPRSDISVEAFLCTYQRVCVAVTHTCRFKRRISIAPEVCHAASTGVVVFFPVGACLARRVAHGVEQSTTPWLL